jgi:hypothetical protein
VALIFTQLDLTETENIVASNAKELSRQSGRVRLTVRTAEPYLNKIEKKQNVALRFALVC